MAVKSRLKAGLTATVDASKKKYRKIKNVKNIIHNHNYLNEINDLARRVSVRELLSEGMDAASYPPLQQPYM